MSEYDDFFARLDDVEESIREAFETLDATEGLTGAGRHAFTAALASLDAMRAAEREYLRSLDGMAASLAD